MSSTKRGMTLTELKKMQWNSLHLSYHKEKAVYISDPISV